MLSKVSVVQPPDWTKDFHVFVDASNIAIGSTLMQLLESNWYIPVEQQAQPDPDRHLEG